VQPAAPSPSPDWLRVGPFAVWVGVVLTGWLTLVASLDLWPQVARHWPISVAMLFGSYVAGSTPMGGGTVGFPILVLLFDMPASLGRSFSFCIQSVGMTSASIWILCRRTPLAWRPLLVSLPVAFAVVPLTLAFAVPRVGGDAVKLVFAGIWGAFGILSLVRLREFAESRMPTPSSGALDVGAGTAIGLVGGAAAGLTGVGIDMVLYCVLMLLYRSDARSAIATSVVLMAVTSWCGAAWSAALGRLDAAVFEQWIAAAPIVLFGAPFGVAVVAVVSRTATLLFVSLLCLAQLVWTVAEVGAAPRTVLGMAVALLAVNAFFHGLYVWGRRRADAARGRPS
jgi:uncharacterized protein